MNDDYWITDERCLSVFTYHARRIARAFPNYTTVEDAKHDLYVECLPYLRKFDPAKASPYGWCVRVVGSKASTRNKRTYRVSSVLPGPLASDTLPESAIEDVYDTTGGDQVASMLSQGYKHQEVRKILGLSVRKYRAHIERLRREYSE